MSWKFAGILAASIDENRFVSTVLNGDYTKTGTIRLSDALKTEFDDIAIGSYDDSIFIVSHLLPYDSAHGKQTNNPFDEKLAHISENGDVLCFFVDGVSGTYGFSYFQHGVKIRSKLSMPDHPTREYGDPLQPELANDSHNDEEIIFSFIRSFLGLSTKEPLFVKSEPFNIYQSA